MNLLHDILEDFPDVRELLCHVMDLFEEYYANIPINFPEYPFHGKQHIESLSNILNWLIPNEVWKELNKYELFCLSVGLIGYSNGMD